jgi:sugar-specific transcriptional regulator TrmB
VHFKRGYEFESLENSFKELGFTSKEAEVYIFLTKKGKKKASEIASALQFAKLQVYFCLNALQKIL